MTPLTKKVFLAIGFLFLFGSLSLVFYKMYVTSVSKEKQNKVFVLTDKAITENAEFYSKSFSQKYQDAYIIYGKAGYALTNENDKTKAYSLYTEAIKDFVSIYNDTTLSRQERAYALNLINCIYIGTHWDDTFFVSTLYTIEPFKSDYEKSITTLKGRLKDKAVLPDTVRVNQSILTGAASQLSMSHLNKLSYDLHPTGYSLLRERMNKMSSDTRFLDIAQSTLTDNQANNYAKYIRKNYGMENLIAFQATLATMDKNGTLYEGMGRIVHEIYVMKTVTLWDPLISQTNDKVKQKEYLVNMKADFLKAANIAKASPLIGVSTMVNLFYAAFLTQYAFANSSPNQVLTEEEKKAYKTEAIDLVHDILKHRSGPYLDTTLAREEYLSNRPKNLPDNFNYFGGVPYYQLRQLAGDDVNIKTYLQSVGWKF